MGRNGVHADIEQIGIAVAAGLLALVAPVVAAVLLGAVALGLAAVGWQPDTRLLRGPLPPLVAVAIAGILLGPVGAVAAALSWRALFEVARTRETQGLSEPPWMAMGYRWAPVIAALLYRLNAPDVLVAAAGAIAIIALCDWALRRLAEWRLGEPQPFDTQAYIASQARVTLMVLIFPDPLAGLAAFTALALARANEARPQQAYAAA
jgi:hypothetical protein